MKEDLYSRLDPEIRETVRRIIMAMPSDDYSNLPASRAAGKKMNAEMRARMPAVQGVDSEDFFVPGPPASPDVKVRIYRPQKAAAPAPVLLWMHGGGYMLGDIDQEDQITAKFALYGNCLVASVEYRLAPENPYPAALEDCYAALKWLYRQAVPLKIDPARSAIGGASAGGGLAAALALLVRDRAEFKPCFQLLVYPMLDDCNIEPACETRPDALGWTRAKNRFGWRSYLGREPGSAGISCYASACRAEDTSGLPAAYIAVGSVDLFAAEDIEYARRLVAAGVSTELHVYPGGCHAFDMQAPDADISRRFTQDIYRALKLALHGLV